MKKQKEAVKVTPNKTNLNHSSSDKNSLFFRYTFFSGVALAIFMLLGFFVFVPAISIITTILMIIFICGFYALGKRYDSKLLKVTSILLILLIFASIFVASFSISPMTQKMVVLVGETAINAGIGITDITTMTSEQQTILGQALMQNPEFLRIAGIFFGLLLAYLLGIIILSILLGVGLIKLKDNVDYAHVAGILQVVGGATIILFGVGFLVLLVAFVYNLIIMYKESKK